jgi:hypothetical protein
MIFHIEGSERLEEEGICSAEKTIRYNSLRGLHRWGKEPSPRFNKKGAVKTPRQVLAHPMGELRVV